MYSESCMSIVLYTYTPLLSPLHSSILLSQTATGNTSTFTFHNSISVCQLGLNVHNRFLTAQSVCSGHFHPIMKFSYCILNLNGG